MPFTPGMRSRLLGMIPSAVKGVAADNLEQPASMFVSFMRKSLNLRLSALARQVLCALVRLLREIQQFLESGILNHSSSVFFF